MTKTMAVFALAVPLLLAGAGAFAQDHPGHEGMAVKETTAQAKAPAKAKKSKAEKAALRKVTAEEVGMEAACPVTREKFSVTEETVSASYRGKSYYFCCPACNKPFMAKPEKYARKKPAAGAGSMGGHHGDKRGGCTGCGMSPQESTASQAKTYICPMGCAESDKPGRCPKCGMDLVEKK